jgi:predicted Zn-dependent protease
MKASKFFLAAACICVSACAANSNLSGLGSSLLSSTGLVSASQADSLFKAGAELAESQTPLSSEEEYYLGRGVSATILSRYKLYKNSGMQLYISQVGSLLAAVSDKPETFNGYRFAILDTDEINAVSAPGGFVFVTRGFLEKLKSEEELAAVLAHEIAHVVKEHGIGAISDSHLNKALVLLGKEAASSAGGSEVQMLTNAFGDSISDVANSLLTKGYSRRQEYEADEYAVELLVRAGYETQGLMDSLKMLEALEAQGSGGWFSTHPHAEDRIDEVESQVKKTAQASAGRNQRLARFAQYFPKNKSQKK